MGRDPRSARGRDERGQALIEAALVIPVLLLVAFGVIMAGRIVHAKIAVQAAAREASREVATATSENAGVSEAIQTAQSVVDGYGLSPERLSVEVAANGFQRGETVTATVRYDVGLGDLPLLGRVGVSVTSSHSERIDLYRSREAVHQ